jgi:DNA-binding transcriptional LysR family regulator
MTLRQLEYLLAVADSGSFTLAAERLHVSQPALSQQVQALEAEVGGPLLDRVPHPVRLTAAGRALAGEARAALASSRRGLDAARHVVGGRTQTLAIATVRSLAVSMLPPAIRRWRERRPGVPVSLREYAHRALVRRALQSGHGDLGVGPVRPDWPGARRQLGWDEFVVILPLDDPLAHTSGPVALEALAGRDWVVFEEGHGLAEHAASACRAAGFEPRAMVQTAQVEAATRLAAAGAGPALVPAKNVPSDLLAHARRLERPIAWRVWAFAAEPEFPEPAAAFVEVLVDGPWQQRPSPGTLELVP